MPWKIVPSHYDPTDPTTLHDDEMIALESALAEGVGTPLNETNPKWRAWQKVRPLAESCTGDGDPVHLLPPEARKDPVWHGHAGPVESTPAAPQVPVTGL